jgi:hypothetical protein
MAETNLIVDGDMELAGTSSWNPVYGSPTLSKETDNPHGGLQSLKILINATANPYILQSVPLMSKRRVHFTGWGKGDGVAYLRAWLGDRLVWVGTTSSDWQYFDVTQTASNSYVYLGAVGVTGSSARFDDLRVHDTGDDPPILLDGDMEWQNTVLWNPVWGASLSKETSAVYEGVRCLRVSNSGGGALPTSGAFCYTPGLGYIYTIEGYTRSDGVSISRLYSVGISGGTSTVLWSGTTATSWQYFSIQSLCAHATLFAICTVGGTYTDWDAIKVVQSQRNLLLDGWMEDSGFSAYSPGNGATLTKETGTPYQGYRCARCAYNGSIWPCFWQNNRVKVGRQYRVRGYARSDGSISPVALAIRSGTNLNSMIFPVLNTGNERTAYGGRE